MPDPRSHADLRFLIDRGGSAQKMSEQIEVQYFKNPPGVRWASRKEDGSARPMVLANPYTELHIRLALHPEAQSIVESQTHFALAGQMELADSPRDSALALRTVPHKETHGDYRARLQLLIDTGYGAAIRSDVHQFYSSVDLEEVGMSLARAASMDVANAVGLALTRSSLEIGNPGLQIGPESSAWFANLLLVEVDRVLERFPGILAARWSDDIVIVGPTRQQVERCLALIATRLRRLGLALSMRKTLSNWKLDISVEELIRLRAPSQGDLWALVNAKNFDELGEVIVEELKDPNSNPARLRRILGKLSQNADFAPTNVEEITSLLIHRPDLWEQVCVRAGRFLAKYASAHQREEMIYTAVDLNEEGFVASEQVVHLVRSAVSNLTPGSADSARSLATSLWRLANTTDCIPVRGWARQAAFELDPGWVNERVIYAQQFDDLHPFEQRWALGFAHPTRDRWWLELQANHGRWPTTAHGRIQSGP